MLMLPPPRLSAVAAAAAVASLSLPRCRQPLRIAPTRTKIELRLFSPPDLVQNAGTFSAGELLSSNSRKIEFSSHRPQIQLCSLLLTTYNDILHLTIICSLKKPCMLMSSHKFFMLLLTQGGRHEAEVSSVNNDCPFCVCIGICTLVHVCVYRKNRNKRPPRSKRPPPFFQLKALQWVYFYYSQRPPRGWHVLV